MATAEKTVRDFVTSFDAAIDAKDYKLVSRTLSPTCERTIGPATLVAEINFPPKLSVEQYEGFVQQQLPFFEKHSTDIHSVTADGANHTGGFHCTYHVKVKGTEEEQVVENLGLLTLTEDNAMVQSILLWGDYAGSKKFMAALTAAMTQGKQ
jgi:hypothetical protein